MLCECCQQNDATIHVTQVVNEKSRELHLCEDCAEQSGLNVQSVMSLPEILFGMGTPADPNKEPDRSCPHCHLRASDFKKTGRLGCPRCYETFADELAPMLAAMHRGTRHAGKTPSAARGAGKVETTPEALRQQLADAVKAEDYERAARLRDLIRESGHDNR